MKKNTPIFSYLREYKFPLLGAGGAILAIIGGFFILQTNLIPESNQDSQVTQVEAANESIPNGYLRRITDGVLIPEEEQPDKVFAVMVENSAEAWPLSGLSSARLVFEAPVEGNIPRFMVIFDDTQEVEEIGPVRSARPYYIEWAYPQKVMYSHVGGSPQALFLLSTLDIRSLNQFFFSQFFWRSNSRYAPHNVYTSIDLLKKGYEYRDYDNEIDTFFHYQEEMDETNRKKSQSITIPFSLHTDLYDARWEYDFENNVYIRWQNSEQQFDKDGDPILASNVVIMFTNVKVIDDLGRLDLETHGENIAMVFHNGAVIEGKWQKQEIKTLLTFVDNNDTEILFTPGNTWIEIVPLSTEILNQTE